MKMQWENWAAVSLAAAALLLAAGIARAEDPAADAASPSDVTAAGKTGVGAVADVEGPPPRDRGGLRPDARPGRGGPGQPGIREPGRREFDRTPGPPPPPRGAKRDDWARGDKRAVLAQIDAIRRQLDALEAAILGDGPPPPRGPHSGMRGPQMRGPGRPCPLGPGMRGPERPAPDMRGPRPQGPPCPRGQCPFDGRGPGRGPGMGPKPPGPAGPGMGPGRGPGMGPERGPGMGPGRGPGMGPERGPGMGPGRGPGMSPGRGPGMGPGRGPGMGPGRGPGTGPPPGPRFPMSDENREEGPPADEDIL